MLSRVPIQVAVEKWDEVAENIAPYFPEPFLGTNQQVLNIKAALATDKAHLWHYVKDNEMYGLVLTAFTGTVELPMRNLVVLAMIRFVDKLKDEDLIEGFSVIKSFAKKNNCNGIVAYTDIPRVVEIAKMLGGKADKVLLTWEI